MLNEEQRRGLIGPAPGLGSMYDKGMRNFWSLLITLSAILVLFLFFINDYIGTYFQFLKNNNPLNFLKVLRISEVDHCKNEVKKVPVKPMSLPTHDMGKNIFVNLTVVVAGGFLFALLGFQYRYFTILLGLVFIHYLWLERDQSFTFLKSRFNKQFFLSLGISLTVYLPSLLNSWKNNQLLGMSSQRNNDVAYYALVAKQFLESGLQENYQVMNLDQNSAVLTQHQGVNQLVSFASTIFNLKTYEVMNILMWFIILITIYILIDIVRCLSKKLNIYVAAIVAGMVVSAPIMTYIYANYFLGQATAYFVELGYFLLFLEIVREKKLSGRNLQLLSVLIALSVYLYPVFLIPLSLLMITVLFVLIYFDKSSDDKGVVMQFTKKLLRSCLIGSFIALPYVPFALDLIFLLKNGSYGWSIRPIDPLSVFVATSYIDYKIPSLSLQVFGWLSTALVLFLLVRKYQTIRKDLSLLVFLILVIVVAHNNFLGNADWGSYKNWKLVTFFMPILLVLFFTSLGASKNFFLRGVFIMLIFLEFSAPFRSWGGILLNEVPSNVLTRNHVQINASEDSILSKINTLNVNMPTWFETMAMASILNVNQIYLNSQSYLPVKSDKMYCILKYREAGDSARYFLPPNYVIIPGLKSGC